MEAAEILEHGQTIRRRKVKTTPKRQGCVENDRFVTYRFHVVFNGENQCLLQLPEFVIRCRFVWEERAQTLLCDVIDLREVEPRWG